MISYGKFIFTHSRNMLSTRSYLVTCYQNVSKSALKSIKETIFPEKPKRPATAFILYAKHIRSKLIAEQPNIKPTEILMKASKEWTKLDPTEKEYFQKEYAKNYTVYVQEVKKYNDSISDEQKQLWETKKQEYQEKSIQTQNRKKSVTHGKPKRPLSPFLSYLSSRQSERDRNTSYQDWLKVVTEDWKNLSDVEKKSYLTETHLLDQYKKDLDEWEEKMIHSGNYDIVRPKTLIKYKHVIGEQHK